MTYSNPAPGNYPKPNSTYDLENQQWWVLRWNDLLNSYRFKKRLERGRRYAREGNILSLEHSSSKVKATVQGTADEPYKLSIWIDRFTDEDWEYIVTTMAQKAVYSAQLLAGEMPANIEEVFTSNGLSLFPFTLSDVHSKCNCPDPKNPCKHIAAVYYQLGDLFGEDPFLIFQLRGRSRDQILTALRQKRSISDTETDQDNTASLLREKPLTQNSFNLETFWQYDEPLDPSLVVITPPTGKNTLQVLGNLPIASGDAKLVQQYLEEIYQVASQQAMIEALQGDQ